MEKLSNLVSMECDPCPDAPPMAVPSEALAPIYPYGLSISLNQPELDKLEVDYDDWSVGDIFTLKAMAKITSISENETTDGKRCRVEMQIIALSGEDSDVEEEAEEEKPRFRPLG